MREPEVVEGLGIDPRHPERVAPDRDGAFQASQLEGALLGEERGPSHRTELVRHAREAIAVSGNRPQV